MKNIFKPTRKKIVITIIIGFVLSVLGISSYAGGWVNCYSTRDCTIATTESILFFATLWPGQLVKFLPKILKIDWFEIILVLGVLVGYYYVITCIILEIIQKLKRKAN